MSAYDKRVTVAQSFLDQAEEDPAGSPAEQYHLGAAQVHATLAQAAATRDLADALNQTVPS